MAWPRNAVRLTYAGIALMLAVGVEAQPASTADANKALIAQGLQAWSDGTASPYDLLAENAEWTITGNSLAAKTYSSKEAFMSEVIRPFNARMREPLRPKVRSLYADGDTVIAFFDASGIARDGKPYTNTYAWILEVKDNRIVRANAFFDSIAFDALWRRVSPVAR